jgi:predicted alpha/beta hydrolase
MEWRSWCLQKKHFTKFLMQHMGKNVFEDFTAPIAAIHTSDDYIANKKTIRELLKFYPASSSTITCIVPKEYGFKKIGHTGIFRKKHENNIWPVIITAMET